MGSPQNYYGVGFYEGRVSTTTTVPGNTDWQNPALSVAGGQWTNPNNAFSDNNLYATETTNNEVQQWTTFDLQGLIPASGVIDGLEVRLTDVSLTGGDDTNCRRARADLLERRHHLVVQRPDGPAVGASSTTTGRSAPTPAPRCGAATAGTGRTSRMPTSASA